MVEISSMAGSHSHHTHAQPWHVSHQDFLVLTAITSTYSGSKTPKSWISAFAGDVKGPKMLKTVLNCKFLSDWHQFFHCRVKVRCKHEPYSCFFKTSLHTSCITIYINSHSLKNVSPSTFTGYAPVSMFGNCHTSRCCNYSRNSADIKGFKYISTSSTCIHKWIFQFR